MKDDNEQNEQESEELLTVRDVAKQLKVSPRTVHEYIGHAGLEAIRLGGKAKGHLRIRARALKEWLNKITINRCE